MPVRAALITAIDTNGEAYMAISTSNTGSEVIVAFLDSFADLLDQLYEDWRSDTVFLFDGASYHRSNEVLEAFQKQGMRVLILGPYSFTGAPIELYFAALKRGDLNPLKETLGRR